MSLASKHSGDFARSLTIIQLPYMKKILRWLATLSITLLIVPVIGIALLYTPSIQQVYIDWATDRITALSKLNIEMDARIRFPLHIEAHDIRIDSLLTIKRLTAHLRIRPLRNGIIAADAITIEQVTLHSDTLMATLQVDGNIQLLRLDNIEFDWKEQHIQTSDIDLWSGTVTMIQQAVQTVKEPSSTRLPLTLHIDKVRARVLSIDYISECFALESSISQLHIGNTNIDTTLTLSLQTLLLEEGNLCYTNRKDYWELQEIGMRIDSVQYSARELSAVVSACTFSEGHGIRLCEGLLSVIKSESLVEFPYFRFRTDESTIVGQNLVKGDLQKRGQIKGTMSATIGRSDIIALIDAFGSTHIPYRSVLATLPYAPLTLSLAMAGTLDTLHIEQCSAILPHSFDLQLSGDIRNISSHENREASLKLQA